jgi:predicted permease
MTASLAGVADALLFRPPDHVAAPEQLFRVTSSGNFPQFEELSRRGRALDVTAVTGRTLSLGSGPEARPIETECVTESYFRVLGARPVVGRAFETGDADTGAPPVTVIAHHVWQQQFGATRDVVGRVAKIAGTPHEVIGVAPAGFRGLGVERIDAWVLVTAMPAACSLSGVNMLSSTRGSWLRTIGRLRPGIGLSEAEAEVAALRLPTSGIVQDSERSHLTAVLGSRASAGSPDRLLSLWLAGGAGLVLLIAAANVAGLLAVRALERQREVVMRLQLGATRSRLFLQLIGENLILTAAAGGTAWLIAGWTGLAAASFIPAMPYDVWFDARMTTLLVVFLAVTTLLSGVVPALQTVRLTTSTGGHDRRGTLRQTSIQWLLTGQIAVTLVLATGAGLFARSVSLAKRNVGYDLNQVLVATLDLDRAGFRRQDDKRRVLEAVMTSLTQVPEVQSMALSSSSPLGSGQSSMVTPGSGPPGSPGASRNILSVTPSYFATIGTRFVEGRTFSADDITMRRSVAIVDAASAAELWPGETVLNQCMPLSPTRPCVEIVGLT